MILDTFYVLFKSNSDDLKKGGEDAIKTTKKVEESLKSAENASDNLGKSFGGMIAKASGALTALISVGAIMGGIHAATEYAHSIGQMSHQLGYSAEVLDTWGAAVEQAGGSAYYFQYTVQSMDIALQEIAKTGEGEAAKAFKKLGINIKDADGNARQFIDLLPDIAKSFEGLSRAQSSALGYKLGLDYGTIQLLQKGGVEIDELIKRQKELGVVTKRDTEVAEKFTMQQKDTSRAFRSLFVSISTEILPIFQKVSKFFETFAITLREHKDVVIGGVLGIATAVSAYLIPSLYRLVTAGKLINGVFAKWFLIIGVLAAIGTAIGLLYDDFMVFREGGDSLIGDIVKEFPELKEIFDAIGDAINWVIGLFKEFNISPLTIIAQGLKGILHVITSIYRGLKDGIELFSDLKNLGGAAVDWVINKVTGNDNSEGKNARSVANSISDLDKNAISSQSSTSIVNGAQSKNNTSNVTTGAITINTQATNPDQIAGAFSNSLKKQMAFAQSNYDDGVRA